MTIERARDLRQQATDVEKILWRHLRNRQLNGWKFRRQHPIGPFVADFCCEDRRLIVELDGGQHQPESADADRTAFLEHSGYRVLRFWNVDVLQNLEGVMETVRLALSESPSP